MHESLLVSGGYNGSIAYWIIGQRQTPHSKIEDAHRQSIDIMAWHPSGHLLATASHDCILKFWCREPAGSKLEPPPNETLQENPPNYLYGPMGHEMEGKDFLADSPFAPLPPSANPPVVVHHPTGPSTSSSRPSASSGPNSSRMGPSRSGPSGQSRSSNNPRKRPYGE